MVARNMDQVYLLAIASRFIPVPMTPVMFMSLAIRAWTWETLTLAILMN